MTFEEIHGEVSAILATVLKKPPFAGETKREDIAEWDSLKHLEIIFSVEDAFSVEFGEEELAGLNSSRLIAEAVLSRKERAGGG